MFLAGNKKKKTESDDKSAEFNRLSRIWINTNNNPDIWSLSSQHNKCHKPNNTDNDQFPKTSAIIATENHTSANVTHGFIVTPCFNFAKPLPSSHQLSKTNPSIPNPVAKPRILLRTSTKKTQNPRSWTHWTPSATASATTPSAWASSRTPRTWTVRSCRRNPTSRSSCRSASTCTDRRNCSSPTPTTDSLVSASLR